MKTLALFLFVLVGCKSIPKPLTFHVTMADECGAVPVTGTMDGIEYALARPAEAPKYAACYGSIRPNDVGQDLHASYDKEAGVITLSSENGPTRYVVGAAREVPK